MRSGALKRGRMRYRLHKPGHPDLSGPTTCSPGARFFRIRPGAYRASATVTQRSDDRIATLQGTPPYSRAFLWITQNDSMSARFCCKPTIRTGSCDAGMKKHSPNNDCLGDANAIDTKDSDGTQTADTKRERERQMAPTSSVPTTGGPTGPRKLHQADEIDYEIKGQEMQFVEIELDPGESTIAEAGALMFKASSIDMDTVFGDGSKQQSGVISKLVGAGKRLLTGESLFMTVFTHLGQGKARVAFAAPYPGAILPFHLSKLGGKLIAQKDAFLCAAKGVSVGIHFQKRIMTGLFGGEGFIMQKLEGDGWVFVHVGGTVIERELAPGEELHVDTGCVAAMTESVDFDIIRAGSIKSMIFGGEGVFFAKLRGPGTVWIQSLPFSRLAGRILANAGPTGGSGEGSILGPIGDIFDGDNS